MTASLAELSEIDVIRLLKQVPFIDVLKFVGKVDNLNGIVN